MIGTNVIEGIEHTWVLFGDGTVIVSSAFPSEGSRGKETDLILSEAKEPHDIGLNVTGTEYEEAACTTEMIKPIILRFNKSKSVDVVLGVLEKIKANLIELETNN